MELSNIYIKDGKLIKYRWDSNDKSSDHHYFSISASNQFEMNNIDYIKLFANLNVVLENDGKVTLHNFDSKRLSLWMHSPEYEQAKFYNLVEES